MSLTCKLPELNMLGLLDSDAKITQTFQVAYLLEGL